MSTERRLERLGLSHLADKPEELQAELRRRNHISDLKEELNNLKQQARLHRQKGRLAPDPIRQRIEELQQLLNPPDEEELGTFEELVEEVRRRAAQRNTNDSSGS